MASPPSGRLWASPLHRRLARRYGRIEFVIPTDGSFASCCSPPVSWRRSYVRLQAGVAIHGEDLHLPDRVRSQTHDARFRGHGENYRIRALLGPFEVSVANQTLHDPTASRRDRHGQVAARLRSGMLTRVVPAGRSSRVAMSRIEGALDGLDGSRVSGWALDADAPERVLVVVLFNTGRTA